MTPELARHLAHLSKMRSPSVSTILSRHCYLVEAGVVRAIEAELALMPTPAPSITKLSERELATVLVALRFWQTRVPARTVPPEYDDYFIEHDPLRPFEIDRLCERLNSGV